MNRLELADQIAKRVPILVERESDDLRALEKLRRGFVSDYPVEHLSQLTLDQFSIGKGKTNRSFCYRIERELDKLGRIRGSTVGKFGVFYDKKEARYCNTKLWGRNVDEAFVNLKRAIVDLLKAGEAGDLKAVRESRVSPMFKGKLLFLYFPEKFAPIYAREHLQHFVSELNISGDFDGEQAMQRALMAFRAEWPELNAQPALLTMHFLYGLFGYPPSDEDIVAKELSLPLLDEAARGAEFIDQMPEVPDSLRSGTKSGRPWKADKQQREWKRVGDRGEALVVAIERRRLRAAGKPELAERIHHVAQEDDSKGYDILSFDDDGTPRPIEVKATRAENLSQGFFLSANEWATAKAEPNYHLYVVFSATTRHPKVYRLKKPIFGEGYFAMRAVSYHVTIANESNPHL